MPSSKLHAIGLLSAVMCYVPDGPVMATNQSGSDLTVCHPFQEVVI